MANAPLTLSVVLPNYNHAAFLPRALTCILGQTRPADEIIVIDDCSTDNSVEVIQEFARKHPQVVFSPNAFNQGTVASLNRGIAMARGDLLFLAASDDLYRPELFARAAAALQDCPQAALFCGQGNFFTDDGKAWRLSYGIKPPARYISPPELVNLMLRRFMPPINSSSTVWRRKPLLEAGSLGSELRWSCDFIAWQIMAFRHGIWYDPTILSDVRHTTTAYSTSGYANSDAQLAVLRAIASRLAMPDLADVAPIFQRTSSLATNPATVWRFAKSEPLGQAYRTPRLFCHRWGIPLGLRYPPDALMHSAGHLYMAVYSRTPEPILRLCRQAYRIIKGHYPRCDNRIVQDYEGYGYAFARSLFAAPEGTTRSASACKT